MLTMPKKYKIIVAHPDDEVLFFSSILKRASQVIICFSDTEDTTINIGRQHLKKKIPLNNYLFLDLKESDVLNTGNWNNPIKFNDSLNPKSYQTVKKIISKVIKYGDTIYTHNPWGEYGHEGHVQVFRAIKDLQKKFNLTILVNGYVSNKSYDLMKLQKHLLSNDYEYKKIDDVLSEKLKKIYISNFCWTWDDDYLWPKNEMFFKIISNKKNINVKKINTPILPIMFFTGDYKLGFFRSYFIRIISLKTRIKIRKSRIKIKKYLKINFQ